MGSGNAGFREHLQGLDEALAALHGRLVDGGGRRARRPGRLSARPPRFVLHRSPDRHAAAGSLGGGTGAGTAGGGGSGGATAREDEASNTRRASLGSPRFAGVPSGW